MAALWAALALLCSCAPDPPSLPRLPDDARILAFGDSLTYGYGVPRDASYPAVLARLTGHEVINAGVSGELSDKGLKRLPKVLDRHRPDLLILCHAGNDVLRRKDPHQIESNLREMIRLTLHRDIPVVLLGVPQPGILLSPAGFYRALAREFDLPFDAELLSDVLGDASLKSDLLHPNEAGYRRMAERVFALLAEAGAV